MHVLYSKQQRLTTNLSAIKINLPCWSSYIHRGFHTHIKVNLAVRNLQHITLFFNDMKMNIFIPVFQERSLSKEKFRLCNPFISQATYVIRVFVDLHYCVIYYLSTVNNDPATTDLIFLRVNIYLGPGEGGLQLILKPIYFIRVTIYPATFPHNISRGHCFLLTFQPIYFIRVNINPAALAHNISRGHINPATYITCFGLYQGHYLHQAFELLS